MIGKRLLLTAIIVVMVVAGFAGCGSEPAAKEKSLWLQEYEGEIIDYAYTKEDNYV